MGKRDTNTIKREKKRMVGGYEYKLVYCGVDDPRLHGDDGVIDLKEKLIYLNLNPTEDTLERNIEHECGHALLDAYGIRDLDEHFEHVIIEMLVDYITELKERLNAT
jgi:hypothetical protein